MSVDVFRAGALGDVAHGFLGRRGGVSGGGDLDMGRRGQAPTPELVENRARVLTAVLPGARLATVYQVHGADVATVTDSYDDDERPHADALVTDRPGLVLGILTADCAPVLFVDAQAGVVGAAHAGWKGALAGVTDATIAAMEALGGRRERIAAAVGPCIARSSYEVDDGFVRNFAEHDPANERFFAAGKPGHHQFDLEAYVIHRLAAAGLSRIEALGRDTYADEEHFFSYRRATHRGEVDYGRQISVIGI